MVELTDQEAGWCAFAFEVQLRHLARNGRGLTADDSRRILAAKLCLAAPVAAEILCPALLKTAGPDVAAQVRELARGTQQARPGEQRAVSELPELMSAREVADASGLSIRGVRQAIRRGSLAATQDQAGRWWIGRHAYQEWGARHAA